MANVKVKSRLAIARWAVDSLPQLAKSSGTYHAADLQMPASWRLNDKGCLIIFTGSVLRLPDDPELSALLDVWLDVGGKVLSVSWFPQQPWVLPWIGRLKSGDWMYRLGWQDAE